MTSCQNIEENLTPRLRIVIPFPNSNQAEIAYNSLRVDREPKRSQVEKTLSLDKHCLIL